MQDEPDALAPPLCDETGDPLCLPRAAPKTRATASPAFLRGRQPDTPAEPLALSPRMQARMDEAARQYRLLSPREKAACTPDDAKAAAMQAGEFAEADLMETCPPAALSTVQRDQQPREYRVVAAYRDGVLEADYLPCEVGLTTWHPAWPKLALKHAAEVLRGLGVEGVELQQEHRVNESIVRREQAQALVPDVARQFPRGHQTFASLEVTEWNRDAIGLARRYVDGIADQIRMGASLSIRHRQTGCGKTALICATAIEAVKRAAVHAYFIYCPELFGGTWQAMEAEIARAIATDLLVLDDIDAAIKPASAPNDPDSSKSRQSLLRIVNERYNRRLPVLWTSNTATLDELVCNLGDRILRRLTERGHPLIFGPGMWDWGEEKHKRRQQRREEAK